MFYDLGLCSFGPPYRLIMAQRGIKLKKKTRVKRAKPQRGMGLRAGVGVLVFMK